MSVDGGEPVLLNDEYWEEVPTFTPVWVLPVGGGAPGQLTDFRSDSIFWFDWSRDGRWLALSRGTQVSDVILISNLQ